MTDRRWRDRARCLDARTDPGDWELFPEDRYPAGSPAYLERVEEVRADFCWQCPVRAECLRDGLEEEYGLWGGLTQEERRQVVQLVCHCGAPIDPKDMLDRNRRHFCPSCRPILFEHTVSFGA